MFQSRNDREGQGTNPIVMILIMMLAPLLASMVQFTISRTREYDADKRGAEICGNPLWLANALQKIEDAVRGHGIHNRDAEQNPATAHVFIINPLLGKGTDNLFSTHPSTSNRVAALHDMAHKQGGFGRGSNVDIERSERENNKSPWR
jgi:heat shock protein HtpX